MIGHQHEAESFPAKPADRQSQSIDKALVVGLVVEDPLARIASAHDMIDRASVVDGTAGLSAAPSNPACPSREPG